MKQRITDKYWNEFEKEFEENTKQHTNSIVNTGNPVKGSWTEKIVSQVRISDLADELGVDECPDCGYGVNFDNSMGWFICIKAKYESSCDFKGNIVNFMERCG